jgi:hypothetical protein
MEGATENGVRGRARKRATASRRTENLWNWK